MTAISLGVRYTKFVFNSIKKYTVPNSIHLCSDSCTALTWSIDKTPHRELFIRSRVADIMGKVENLGTVLHYICSEANPADLLTKDKGRSITDPLWTKGPPILLNPEKWLPFKVAKAKKDIIPVFMGNVPRQDNYDKLPDPSQFESLLELYKSTIESRTEVSSIVQAQNFWITNVQDNNYPEIKYFFNKVIWSQVKKYRRKGYCEEV